MSVHIRSDVCPYWVTLLPYLENFPSIQGMGSSQHIKTRIVKANSVSQLFPTHKSEIHSSLLSYRD